MRLGGPIFEKFEDAESWALACRRAGYSAAWLPLPHTASDSVIAEYVRAAKKHDLLLGELGAWSNTISTDDATRREAITKCQNQLGLAERAGVTCVVNITGSRGKKWDGPDPRNLTQETFDLVVATVREIIDAVKPKRSFYTLETMPWTLPDSADSYLRLIRAIDRERFAVHFDPVNLVNCPERYYDTAGLIHDCFAKLGPWIKSCHAKDILIAEKLTLHLDECRPGVGALCYKTFLTELARLDPDVTLYMEHLPNADEYRLAGEHIRAVANQHGVVIR